MCCEITRCRARFLLQQNQFKYSPPCPTRPPSALGLATSAAGSIVPFSGSVEWSGLTKKTQNNQTQKQSWGKTIFWIRIISLILRRAHPHKHMNQHDWVGGLGELQTREWQETWWGETAGRALGKGTLRNQHHLMLLGITLATSVSCWAH